MKSRNLVSKVLGLTSSLVITLAGCKTPEQKGYENTYLALQVDGSLTRYKDKIAISTLYDRGVDMVQLYGDHGNLLFTDNLNQFSDTIVWGGCHIDLDQEINDKELTVRVFSPDGHTFKKTFKNPRFDEKLASSINRD